MTPIIEDAILGSDLDAQLYYILNLGGFDPVPSNLVQTDDPRLTDQRSPLPGTITDASVAAGAGIVQSKLLLDGVIPTTWLGSTSATAAQGDLAEYLANKDQPNGYASLDGSGKVPAVLLPGTTGTGTVTSVGLTMPAEFTVSGSPVTIAGDLAVNWASIADLSWFGNKSGAPAAPQFYNTALPTALIPSLDTSIVTTGTFDTARLPVAVGVGGSHAPGAVPDPGASGDVTDYLARDMTYKTAPSIGPTYQPTLPNPTFGVSGAITGPVMVTAQDTVTDAVFFYSLTSASTGFAEFPDVGYVNLPAGDSIWVYAAHPGYNNSGIVTMTNNNPP